MSKKQNKKLKQIKSRISTDEMERQLLKTTFPLECESLPLEKLSSDEQDVVNKCMNYEELNEDEFKLLKKTLQRYRPALQKLKPEETLDNVDKAVQLISSEKEFLDLMDNDVNKYLTVRLPYKDKKLQFDFEVLPLKDSRVVEALELQVSLFKDYSIEETALYATATTKNEEDLTDEEKDVLEKMNEDLAKKISQQKIASVDNFLAHQLRIKDSDSSVELRREFWGKFHFNAKFSVFIIVQQRLGLTEINNQELFPFGE